jgi:hypothetical protein
LLQFLERHPERFRVAGGKDGKVRFQVLAPTPADGGDRGGQASASAASPPPPSADGGDQGGQASASATPPPPPAAPPLEPVASWKVGHVVFFLNHLELPHLADIIKREGVDGPMLLNLINAGQLCDLGFSKFQAQKIIERLPAADGVQNPSSSSR